MADQNELNALYQNLRDIRLSLRRASPQRRLELQQAAQRIVGRLRQIAPEVLQEVSPADTGIMRETRTTPQAMVSALEQAPGGETPSVPGGTVLQAMTGLAQATRPSVTNRPSPKPAKKPAKMGAPASPTLGETATPAERVPDSGLIERQAEDSPELAAFKAALEAPAPVFMRAGFSPGEQAALGFLAGLRGVGAVLPIIEQRRREAETVYDAARSARAERLSGLAQVAQMARAERAEKRAVVGDVTEREQFEERKREFGITSKERQREFDIRIAETREAREMRLQMARQPTLPAINQYNDVNSAVKSITRLRELIDKGRGGPLEMTGAAIANYIPGVSQLAFVQENREIVAELANLNTLFGPDRLGANIPAGERELIAGILREPRSTVGDLQRAIGVVERHFEPLREQLIRRYDFGLAAPRGPNGLTPTQEQEEKELLSSGYRRTGTSPAGNPIYYRGPNDQVELIPDAR